MKREIRELRGMFNIKKKIQQNKTKQNNTKFEMSSDKVTYHCLLQNSYELLCNVLLFGD